jgi:hypothetical protein
MPRPGGAAGGPPVELARDAGGRLEALVWQPGTYVVTQAGGAERTFTVGSLPAPVELAGPWEVRFAPGWGAPEAVTFERLEDWTQRPEDGIKHFSGTAVYRTTFEIPAALGGYQLSLDLGAVCDLAAVRLNGRDLGTLWLAPWRVDVTAAVRPGTNALEVAVTNPWNNRLVGDAALAQEKRRTFLAAPTVSRNAPLMPAGLLGPVTLRAAKQIELR